MNPCPFCGGTLTDIVRRRDSVHADTTYHMVLCHGCCAEGPCGLNDEDAARQWDRRQPDGDRAEKGRYGDG